MDRVEWPIVKMEETSDVKGHRQSHTSAAALGLAALARRSPAIESSGGDR
ncbi:MAG TPA: hypothetical protein VIM50_02055 [Candidatus Limnocylindria bacterium]|jgi:hypothetical protein